MDLVYNLSNFLEEYGGKCTIVFLLLVLSFIVFVIIYNNAKYK